MENQLTEYEIVGNHQNYSDATVYLYMRPLKSAPQSNGQIGMLTHWGVVVVYFDEHGSEDWWIYEALKRNGKLRVKRKLFKQADRDIPGAQLKVKMQNTRVCQENVDNFCDEKNAENADYNIMHSNCQEFATDLLVELSLPSEFSFRQFVKNALASSSRLSQAIFSSVLKNNILKPFLKAGAGAQGAITQTLTEAGIGIGEAVSKQIANEVVENASYQLVKGAFTWWQLLQIPAEIISRVLGYQFFEKVLHYNHDESSGLSYGASKLVSLGTAMAIGCVAGPFGVAGGALFWVCGEVITCLFRAALTWGFGKRYTDKCGTSDYMRFLKTCKDLFWPKIIEIITRLMNGAKATYKSIKIH